MLQWDQIETVLLDMDGTLLDLHFDNHFWLTHLPQRYAEEKEISFEQAHDLLTSAYREVMGSLKWYCLDYWQERLQMDIVAMKREVANRISLRPDTLPFLDTLKDTGRQVILLTNAHPDSLSLKVERTQLDKHLHKLYTSHEFGAAKEQQQLWSQLQRKLGFEKEKTLFVDDSASVLAAARTYGIKHLLAVANPDSQQPARQVAGYHNIKDYRTLLSDIRQHPI
ncbi:GMP/IMP nucleotidase [Corallincola platygyrae]